MDTESASEPVKDNMWKASIDYIDDYYLMPSPIPIVCIALAYLLIVLKIGPSYMKYRPAYDLRMVIVVYNCLQAFFSLYLWLLALDLLKPHNYIFLTCHRDERKLVCCTYAFFISRIVDLFDTVFFVLRKKYNQVSFLHVYHHVISIIMPWLLFKFMVHDAAVFLGLVNSFVHIIMYTYYALSAYPSLRRYLWWKKYITVLQLVQFVVVLTHIIINSIIGECKPSYILTVLICLNQSSMLYLFGKFYIKSYQIPKVQDKPIKNNKQDGRDKTQ